jgi:hypothetical protein
MRSGIFILGLIVLFAGELAITPTFRFVPLIVVVAGAVIAAVGAVLPRRSVVTQTVSQ